ncbi:Uncharacterized protein APZ42_012304, partial [Daphnia magna]
SNVPGIALINLLSISECGIGSNPCRKCHFGQVYPFAFALRTRKTRALYDVVLDNIQSIYDGLYPDVNLCVEKVMFDLEKAMGARI